MGVNPIPGDDVAAPPRPAKHEWWLLWFANLAVLVQMLTSCRLAGDVERLQDRIDQMPRFVFQIEPPAEVPAAPVENET